LQVSSGGNLQCLKKTTGSFINTALQRGGKPRTNLNPFQRFWIASFVRKAVETAEIFRASKSPG
jgi:hypothetical protein